MQQTMTLRTFILSIALVVSVNAYAAPSKHVLVLHTYHQGFEWTDHITQGVASVFAPFKADIAVHVEYLDSHRNDGAAYYQALEHLFSQKFSDIRLQAVIASNLEAVQFARSSTVTSIAQAPLIFCGVTKDHFNALPQVNEIGVYTQIDHRATLDLMLALHPQCRTLVILTSDRLMQHRSDTPLEAALAPLRPNLSINWLPVSTSANLPAKLVALDKTSLIYLFVPVYDLEYNDVAADDLLKILNRWSPVPIYTSLDFYLDKGVVGGMITSGKSQGEQAARLALRLISGQSVQTLTNITNSPNQYMFDGRQLRRFHIKEKQLPRDSIILHPQPLLWKRHGIFFIGLVAALIFLNAILLLMLVRRKNRQTALAQANMELDSRMREKSAHLQLANQRLKKQSLTDGVTGMPNRRHIYQRLVEEAKKAQRYDLSLAIIMLTVDGYKQINDTHDYLLAERILRDLGQTIKRQLREVDLLGRYGGESFLVVLPNTNQGHHSAQRIHNAAKELNWEHGEEKVTITISVGMAQMEKHTPAELIALAEKRLELAKSLGGNRIMAVDEDDADTD